MKYIVLCIAIMLSTQGCGSTPTKPTPFETDKAVGVPEGCHDLKKETEKYNKEHPDKPKRIADC